MRRISLLTALAALLLALPAGGGRRRASRPEGCRFRARHRDEPVRRLRLRARGQRLQDHPRPLLRGHAARVRARAARARPAAAERPYIRFRGATSANGEALSKGTTYIARRSGSGIVLRTSGGRRVGRFPGTLSASAGGTEPGAAARPRAQLDQRRPLPRRNRGPSRRGRRHGHQRDRARRLREGRSRR